MKGIKNLRESCGITRKQLADKLNLDASTVAKWETGASKPRADTLIKLSELFGCTIDELLENEPCI